jgi:Fe-S-cluster-containing hydrogenase component 2
MSIYPERCLNNRSSADYCRICVDVCPLNAIDLSVDGVRFDASQCNECALCVSDCPTETFTHREFAPLDVVALAAGKTKLGLICRFSDAEKVVAGSLAVPCLGLLDDILLAGLRAAGVEQLYLYGLNKCGACLSRVGGQRLSQTVEAAAVQSYFPDMRDMSENVNIVPLALLEDRPDREAVEKPMSRRGFLGSMAKDVAYVAISTLPDSLQYESGLVASFQNECMVKHVPQSQQLALSNISDLGMPAGTSNWFHEVCACGECDACNICSLACPSGALYTEKSEHRWQLHHRAAACIACGLCTSLCPHQALQLQPLMGKELILDEEASTLYECRQSACSACGRSFTSPDGQVKLCSPCENERLIENQWLER